MPDDSITEINSLPSDLKPYKRKAWRPVTTDEDGPVTASKFSGISLLMPGEQWPACPNCGKPLQLFVQLNLTNFPEEMRDNYGDGILQLFYCTTEEPLCEVDCEAFFPNSRSTLVRIIQPGDTVSDEPSTILGPTDPFPAKTILGWEALDDYPSEAEAASLEIDLAENVWQTANELELTRPGDKLGGWPCWVQYEEYPECPVCRQKMQLLFQIDSDDNLPFMFGDAGCGYITQCKKHKDQVAFGWQCC